MANKLINKNKVIAKEKQSFHFYLNQSIYGVLLHIILSFVKPVATD